MKSLKISLAFLFFSCSQFSFAQSFSLMDRIVNLPEAEEMRVSVTDSISKNSPAAIVFISSGPDSMNQLFLRELPTLFQIYNPQIGGLGHGNMAFVLHDKDTFGLTAIHLFGYGSRLKQEISTIGVRQVQDLDMVIVPDTKVVEQFVSKASFLDSILLGSLTFITRGLNCWKGDSLITEFFITGVSEHFAKEDIEFLFKNGDFTGNKITQTFPRGAYLTKISKEMWEKMPGMSGCSVTTNLNGKEFFVGLHTDRMRVLINGPQGAFTVYFAVTQPIFESDF
ncbi:MAG: hypothetical protein AAB438_00855 [Patescibacteria group bacterium]